MERQQIHTSGVSHTDGIREEPPGVPLYLDNDVANLKRGDHILYQVCQESCYRAYYRSALVLTDVEETRIHVVMNSTNGVKEEWLDPPNELYIVMYSHCYSSDEAVQRAMQRFHWNENSYHCLYNNSHHFVTLAKTGRENSLTEIIESLTHQEGMFCQTLFFLSLYKSGVISFVADWRFPIPLYIALILVYQIPLV